MLSTKDNFLTQIGRLHQKEFLSPKAVDIFRCWSFRISYFALQRAKILDIKILDWSGKEKSEILECHIRVDKKNIGILEY